MGGEWRPVPQGICYAMEQDPIVSLSANPVSGGVGRYGGWWWGFRIRHQILWVETSASGDFCYAMEH